MFRVMILGLCGFFFTPHLHWVRVKDTAYRAHWRYEEREADGSIYVVGEYYEVAPGDLRASCYPERIEPRSEATEAAARQLVEGCTR